MARTFGQPPNRDWSWITRQNSCFASSSHSEFCVDAVIFPLLLLPFALRTG